MKNLIRGSLIALAILVGMGISLYQQHLAIAGTETIRFQAGTFIGTWPNPQKFCFGEAGWHDAEPRPTFGPIRLVVDVLTK